MSVAGSFFRLEASGTTHSSASPLTRWGANTRAELGRLHSSSEQLLRAVLAVRCRSRPTTVDPRPEGGGSANRRHRVCSHKRYKNRLVFGFVGEVGISSFSGETRDEEGWTERVQLIAALKWNGVSLGPEVACLSWFAVSFHYYCACPIVRGALAQAAEARSHSP